MQSLGVPSEKKMALPGSACMVRLSPSLPKHVPCTMEKRAPEPSHGTKGPLVEEVWEMISEIPSALYPVKGSEKSCSKDTSSLSPSDLRPVTTEPLLAHCRGNPGRWAFGRSLSPAARAGMHGTCGRLTHWLGHSPAVSTWLRSSESQGQGETNGGPELALGHPET